MSTDYYEPPPPGNCMAGPQFLPSVGRPPLSETVTAAIEAVSIRLVLIGMRFKGERKENGMFRPPDYCLNPFFCTCLLTCYRRSLVLGWLVLVRWVLAKNCLWVNTFESVRVEACCNDNHVLKMLVIIGHHAGHDWQSHVYHL